MWRRASVILNKTRRRSRYSGSYLLGLFTLQEHLRGHPLYLGLFLLDKFMLTQNYIRVFENESGTVTIVSGHDDEIQRLNLESLTLHYDDILAVSKALKAIADNRGDE